MWVSLNCDTDGRPKEFAARLPAGRRMASLSRGVGVASPTMAPAPEVTSPLGVLVREGVYAGRAAGPLGAAPPNAPAFGRVEMEQWGAVVVERGAPPE